MVVTDDNGCSVDKGVTLTINPVYSNVPMTHAICEGNSYDFPGTMLTTADTYTHNGATLAGCDSTVNLTLTVNPLPWATISGNTELCPG